MTAFFNVFKPRSVVLIAVAVWATTVASGIEAQGFEPEPGAAVEVREGDVWSSAEFVAKEGRRYQIRYEDGAEEWITQDRLRAPGGDAGAEAETPAKPPRKVREKALYKVGQKVELYDNRWKDATVKRAIPPLYLVATNDSWGEDKRWWTWVAAESVRQPGEDREDPDRRTRFEHEVGRKDSLARSHSRAKAAYAKHQLEHHPGEVPDLGGEGADELARLTTPVSEADRSEMQTVFIEAVGWDTPVVDPVERAVTKNALIKLRSGKNDFFDSVQRFDVAGSYALAVIEEGGPGEEETIHVERINLVKRKSMGTVVFHGASTPEAISPDGERVASVSTASVWRGGNRLDLWNWAGNKPEHLRSFLPFGSEGAISQVLFLTPDTVLTRSKSGSLSVWEVGTGRGVWEAEGVGKDADVVLSPGRNVLALIWGKQILLIDALTGEPRGSLPEAKFEINAVSFSADGKTLVAGGEGRIQGWNLEDGQAWPNIGMRGEWSPEPVAFDGGYALADGWVYDLTNGRPVWAYNIELNSSRAERQAGGGRLLALYKDRTKERDAGPAYAVAAWVVPTASSRDGLEKMRAGDPPTLLFRDGDQVSIDLSKLGGKRKERDEIEASLTKQLEARGVTVAKDQPVRIVGVTTSKSEKRSYRKIGESPFKGGTAVNVTTKSTRLAIEVDGVTAWSRTMGSSGGWNVSIKEGQSIQSAVNESVNQYDPTALFNYVTLPDLLPDPRHGPDRTSTLGPGRVR